MANKYLPTVQNGITVISAELFNNAFDQIGEDIEKLELDNSVNGTTLEVLEEDVDVLETNPFYYGKIFSYDEFPEEPVKGTICEIGDTFASNGVLYSGIVNDLLVVRNGSEVSNEEENKNRLYAYKVNFTPPSNCIKMGKTLAGEERVVCVYKLNGTKAENYSLIHVDNPLNYPLYIWLDSLGVENGTDYVSFWLGEYDGENYPETIDMYAEGSFVIWNGEEWKKISSSSDTDFSIELEEIKEQIGDIDSAFDELHAYAQALVNGGTE